MDKVTRYGEDMSGGLFDRLITDIGLKNDAALARFLQVQPPIISKVRHGRSRITSDLLIHIYDMLKRNGAAWKFDDLREAVPPLLIGSDPGEDASPVRA